MEDLKKFTKEVKKVFEEKVLELGYSKFNLFKYNDKLKDRRRIVFKSYGSVKYKEVWESVMKEMKLEEKGWGLFEGSSYRGDGSVYGIIKYSKLN